MSEYWFSAYNQNSDVRRAETFDEAVKLIEQETEEEINLENIVSMRGTMISVEEGYQVPGFEMTDSEPTLGDEEGLTGVNPRGGELFPDYIASIDEALKWGSEKGSETEWIRTAGYAGDKSHISHCWEAMNSASYNLDKWNVSEKDQEKTRPVLFVYDDEFIDHSRGGYDTGLPANPEERAQAIDYAVIVDQNPASDDFEI